MRKTTGVLYISNALIYGFTGLYYCFIQLYLTGETTHSVVDVGILLSVGQFIAIIAPMFWGLCTDKARYKKNILLIMVAIATVFYCAVPYNDNFWWLAVTIGGTMFALSTFGSVLDVICMEFAMEAGRKYGPMRLMGMFGYGFVSFGLSFLLEENIRMVFRVCAVIGILSAICVMLMPKIEGHAHSRKYDFLPVLKEKKLLILIALLALGQFAYGYYQNYFPTYITKELSAPMWFWGLNVLLTTIGELPFFLWFDKLFTKVGMKKLLCIILSMTIVRYILLACFTQLSIILVTGAITGMVSVAMLYCANYYVNRKIDPALHTSAQTFVYSVGLGIPRMISAFVGGIMTDCWGTRISLAVCAAVAAVGFIIYMALGRKSFE